MVGDVLLLSSCAGCGSPGAVVCPRCVDALRPAGPVAAPPGVDRCVALVEYDGVGRELVLALKYGNARALVTAVGSALAVELGPAATDVDVVTWAPTSTRRRHERGYDQAQLLARSIARHLGRRAAKLLIRVPGPPQTGRTRDERLVGPAFRTRRQVPRRVLLVDDVITSGATLTAAAQALRRGGAAHVVATTVARTPDATRAAGQRDLRDHPL